MDEHSNSTEIFPNGSNFQPPLTHSSAFLAHSTRQHSQNNHFDSANICELGGIVKWQEFDSCVQILVPSACPKTKEAGTAAFPFTKKIAALCGAAI